jgi:hypothetical protein
LNGHLFLSIFGPLVWVGFALIACPAWASESFDGKVFYLGDMHAHSGASGDAASTDLGDCTGTCGSLEGIGETARANGLDFLALTDHVNGATASLPADFLTGIQRITTLHDPVGGFVTIPGADLIFKQTETAVGYGHKTLLMFGETDALSELVLDDVRPGPVDSTFVSECADIWAWMDELTATFGPALLVPHHPAMVLPMPTAWDCHNDTYAPTVEVYSEQGASLGLDDGYATPWSGEFTAGTVADALNVHGHQLGFVGGSDNHDTRPGDACATDSMQPDLPYGQGLTVAVLAEGELFDRDSLYRAFVSRQTYATTGPMVPISVEWSDNERVLGGMGEALVLSDGGTPVVEVRVPLDMASFIVEVWLHTSAGSLLADGPDVDGRWQALLYDAERPRWAYVEARVDGALWYASDTCEEGGFDSSERLWMSPSWFTYVTDFDGDGWSTVEGDCDDYSLGVHPFGEEDCVLPGDEDCNGMADSEDPVCHPDTGISDSGDTDGEVSSDQDTAVSDEPAGDDGLAIDDGPDLKDTGDDGDGMVGPGEKSACGGCATGRRSLGLWFLPGVLLWTRRRR